MDVDEIKNRWEHYRICPCVENCKAPDDIHALLIEVENLQKDLKLNASMLARQCDMARDAENRAMEAEALLKKMIEQV